MKSALILVLAAALPAATVKNISRADLRDKIAGGWAGQMIGVSFGAWLLLEMATKQPQSFSTLVLISPVGVKVTDRETAQFADLFARDIGARAAALYADPQRADDVFVRVWVEVADPAERARLEDGLSRYAAAERAADRLPRVSGAKLLPYAPWRAMLAQSEPLLEVFRFIGLFVLGASGIYLWWTLRRDRRAGAVLLALGCAIAGVLAVWMRLG